MILDVMRRQKRVFAWLFLPVLVVGLVGYLIPGSGVWGQEIGAPFVARVGSTEISHRNSGSPCTGSCAAAACPMIASC